MTFEEMAAFTVDGGKATSDLMHLGWVDYQFNGWRINFPNGSHSGISFTAADRAAEWREYVAPVKAWGEPITMKVPVKTKKANGWKGHEKDPMYPLPINDIGDWKAKPEPVNPWAQIKAKSGWDTYQ